jgi:hypothetical protein
MKKFCSHLLLLLVAMQALGQWDNPTPAPASGNTTNPGNIAYFSSASGSDSNPCTFLLPCQTQSKAQSLLPPGGITLALKGGDHFFWEKLGMANHVSAGSSTTYATNPVLGQNVTVTSYGTGPYILEGADEIQGLPWTSVDGTTYKAVYPAGTVIAETVYIDLKDKDSAGVGNILPAPNGPAVAYASAVYQPGQIVTNAGHTYVVANIGPTSTTPGTDLEAWRQAIVGSFSTTATGVQNVQAVPGSYYNDIANNTIYMHLADGSSPATHVVQASNRSSGIQCESCNSWLVNNGIIEKYYYNGAAFVNYSQATSTNKYYTNINNQIDHMQMWDNASQIRWLYTGQSGQPRLWRLFQAGITMNGTMSASADNAAYGTKITNSYFGRSGNPGGVGGDGSIGTVYVSGFNSPEVGNNTAFPWTANGFSVQSSTDMWTHDNVIPGQFRGCAYCISNNLGAIFQRNKAKNGAGQGIQTGGSASSTGVWDYTGHPENDVPGAHPYVIEDNEITDLGIIGTALYNCIDSNTNLPVKGILYQRNTLVNCWGAGATFEVNNNVTDTTAGVTDVTFRLNYVSMRKNYGPYTDSTRDVSTNPNGSLLLYFADQTSPGVRGFFHSYGNVFEVGTQSNAFKTVGNCQAFKARVNDTTSVCVASGTTSPVVTDIVNGDYRLKKGSPALNMGAAGVNAGALSPDYTPSLGARYRGASSFRGSAIHR